MCFFFFFFVYQFVICCICSFILQPATVRFHLFLLSFFIPLSICLLSPHLSPHLLFSLFLLRHPFVFFLLEFPLSFSAFPYDFFLSLTSSVLFLHFLLISSTYYYFHWSLSHYVFRPWDSTHYWREIMLTSYDLGHNMLLPFLSLSFIFYLCSSLPFFPWAFFFFFSSFDKWFPSTLSFFLLLHPLIAFFLPLAY